MNKILEPFYQQGPIELYGYSSIILASMRGTAYSYSIELTHEQVVRDILERQGCEVIMLVGYSDE